MTQPLEDVPASNDNQNGSIIYSPRIRYSASSNTEPDEVKSVVGGGSGGGDGGGDDMAGLSREELDAKLDLTKAQVDGVLSELKAEFEKERADRSGFREEMTSRLGHLPSKGFLATTAVALAAVMVGAIALGFGGLFGGIVFGERTTENRLAIEKVVENAQADRRAAKEQNEQILQAIQQLNIRTDADAATK
jgi:hypothetical protein